MCHNIAQAVWDYSGDDLDGVQTAVLSRMGWYAAWDGTAIYPSLNTLSKQIKFNRRTVIRAVDHLIKNNFITLHSKANCALHQANHYRINFEKLSMPIPFEMAHLYKTKKTNKRSPSVTESLGASVTESPGASVTESPNKQLIKTINKDNNKGVVVSDIDCIHREKLMDELIKLGLKQKVIDRMLIKFSISRIAEVIKMYHEAKGDGPGWIVIALRDNWLPNDKKTSPMASSLAEQTAKELQKIENTAKRHSERLQKKDFAAKDNAIREISSKIRLSVRG